MKKNKLITCDTNNEDRIERKHLQYLMDACQKLSTQCDKKDLKVCDIQSQPYYNTVFKQIRNHLELILNTDTSKNLDNLNKIEFLLCMKNDIYKLFSEFSSYIAHNYIIIGEADSMQRSRFFQTIVHYQFLALELLDYFPEGHYRPDNVKIAKPEAKAWWANKFPNRIFVNREEFMTILSEDFQLINDAESLSFESCINFTKTSFVTTFEFDLITRLYAPWERFIEVWRAIFFHPAYLHFSTYVETIKTLSKHLDKIGTYVFRVSCNELGCWTIGYVKATREIGQLKVDRSNLIETLNEGKRKNMYLYPNGKEEDRELKNFAQIRKEIVVSKDDLDLYASFDDFKECKICREAEKNLQMESCGHQICEGCFSMLKKYDRKLCPFCNQPIKSTTKVCNIRPCNEAIYLEHSKNESSDEIYIECQFKEEEDEEELDIDTIVSNSFAHFPPPPRKTVVQSNDPRPLPSLPAYVKVEYPTAFPSATNDPPAVPPLPADNFPNLNRNPSLSSNHTNMRSNSSDEYSTIQKPPIQDPYGASKEAPPLPPLPKLTNTDFESDVYSQLGSPEECLINPIEGDAENIREKNKSQNEKFHNIAEEDAVYISLREPDDRNENSQSEISSSILNGDLTPLDKTANNTKAPSPKPRRSKNTSLLTSANEDLNNSNSDDYFEGKWTQDLIERALKVANGDKSLAKNILLEFFTPIS